MDDNQPIPASVLDEIERGLEGVTAWTAADLMRYEHGGGRLAIIRDGKRDLIADFYGEEVDREFFARLDPHTVRELIRLARIGMKAEGSGYDLTDAELSVIAERERQKTVEGWTAEHDDDHTHAQMAGAAACYALAEVPHWFASTAIESLWPWGKEWWKPAFDARRNLVKAGALILAEIERLDRAAAPETGDPT